MLLKLFFGANADRVALLGFVQERREAAEQLARELRVLDAGEERRARPVPCPDPAVRARAQRGDRTLGARGREGAGMRILTGLLPALGLVAATALASPLPPRLAALHAYDASRPLDVREVGMQMRSGSVTVHDLTFASPKRGRVPAYLVLPPGKGAFPGGRHGAGGRTATATSSSRISSTWPSVVSREWRSTPAHAPRRAAAVHLRRAEGQRDPSTTSSRYGARSTCSPRAPRSTQRASPIRASVSARRSAPFRRSTTASVLPCCRAAVRHRTRRRLRAAPLLALVQDEAGGLRARHG